MPDYNFTFYKKVQVVIEAANENDAWIKIAQLNPDTLGADWEVDHSAAIKTEIPLDQGPVEIDDWGPEEF